MNDNMNPEEKLKILEKKIEIAKELDPEKKNDKFQAEIENLEKAAEELGDKLGKLFSSMKWKNEAKQGKKKPKRGRGYTKPLVKKGRGSKARKKK